MVFFRLGKIESKNPGQYFGQCKISPYSDGLDVYYTKFSWGMVPYGCLFMADLIANVGIKILAEKSAIELPLASGFPLFHILPGLSWLYHPFHGVNLTPHHIGLFENVGEHPRTLWLLIMFQ